MRRSRPYTNMKEMETKAFFAIGDCNEETSHQICFGREGNLKRRYMCFLPQASLWTVVEDSFR
jgi:hypothetical protein